VEPRDRNLLIVFVAFILLLCLCALVVIAIAAGNLLITGRSTVGGDFSSQARMEQSFAVGASPSLRVDNFAGSVTVQAGGEGQIRVVAIKRAQPGTGLDRIQVRIEEQDGGLLVETSKPGTLGNASVQLEITVPADARLDLHTGAGSMEASGVHGGARLDTGSGSIAIRDLRGDLDLHTGSGSVDVRDVNGPLQVDSGSGSLTLQDVTGDVEAHTGSGSISLQGAAGRVQLDTGSGSLEYEGRPQANCRFETGSGSILLRLPRDLDARLELDTGTGTVDVDEAFGLAGEISRRRVEGILGSGGGVSIRAHTGSGDVDLLPIR